MTRDGSQEKYPFLMDDGAAAMALATDASRASTLRIPDSGTSTNRKGRVDSRFLKNVVSSVEGHNSALLRKERQERLGLRRHPLADRILALEREKSQAGRRRISKSPKATNERATHSSRREAVRQSTLSKASAVGVRGRGGRTATLLDSLPSTSEQERSEDPKVDDIAGIVSTSSGYTKNTRLGDDIFESETSLQIPRKQVIIEEDERGKWKCGAGYL